jgi:pyruvyltransferase
MKVNLRHWTYSDTVQNFGDALSPYIVSRLIGQQYKLICNGKRADKTLFAIGSWLHYATEEAHIWGTGLRTDPPMEQDATHCYNTLHVHAVRGPMTRSFLLKRGIDCPEIYGDPALLLPMFYSPRTNRELDGKVGFIPHCSDVKRRAEHEGYHFINPLDPVEHIIDQIASCSAIVSQSLHGLIVSDAYGVPNAWLYRPLAEGTLKFIDYFASQNREPFVMSSPSDTPRFYSGGNQIALSKLIDAFPFQ